MARILMDYWAKALKRLAERTKVLKQRNPVRYEGLRLHLLKKYVDDCLLALGRLKLGTRWDTRREPLCGACRMRGCTRSLASRLAR